MGAGHQRHAWRRAREWGVLVVFVSPLPFIYRYVQDAAAAGAAEWPILSRIVWRTHGDVDDPMNELVCRVQMTISRIHPSGPTFAATQIRARLYMTGPDGDEVSDASDALVQAIEKAWRSGMVTSEGWATYLEWTQLPTPETDMGTTADYINMVSSLQVTARKGA